MKLSKKIALSVLFILTSAFGYLSGQNFKGQVTDMQGVPIIGANIFIQALNQGIVCNDQGHYEITLSPANYQIIYRCLGYEEKAFTVEIPQNTTIEKNVQLKEKTFALKEIAITAQNNPADHIMRNAIAQAPIYADAVKSYTAEVYLKGGGKVNKVNKLIDNLSKDENGLKLSDIKDQYFVLESFNELIYTTPNHYEQKVQAFSSTVPSNFYSEDSFPVISSSLYTPKEGILISPLHPKAFSYYKFAYEGYWKEDELIINKIKITPKVKDPVLYTGYIYIVENSWYIYSADLNCDIYGVKENYNILYQSFGNNIHLPISYAIQSKINTLGIDLDFRYYASLTYSKIEGKTNDENNAKTPIAKKRNFNLGDSESHSIKTDSMAHKRDSTYWKKIRVLPLDTLEIDSYKKKDSIQLHIDSIKQKHVKSKFSFSDIFMGGKIQSDSSKISFKYDGLLMSVQEYNFVDGFHIGQKFNLSYEWNKYKKLKFEPFAYYATARKRMLLGAELNFAYDPIRLGNLSITAGSNSQDFNPNGISRLNNALSSLITGKNYDFLYQKDYFTLLNQIDLFNGFKFIAGLDISKRYGLDNHTEYTWGAKRKITPNLNPNKRFDRTAYTIAFAYSPYAYYKIEKGVKRYVRSSSPTFLLLMNQAFSSWQTNNSKFIKLRAELFQSIAISEFSSFNYLLEGGSFIGSKNKIAYADYQTFNTSNVFLNFKSSFNSFVLLDNYQASTNSYWVNSIVNYTSNYLFLKYIPFFQGKIFSESLQLKALYTQQMKPYTEIGYSVNFTSLVSVGIYSSFEKTKYKNWGIRISTDIDRIKRIIN